MKIETRIHQIATDLHMQVAVGFSAYGSGSWWAQITDTKLKECDGWYSEGDSPEAALNGALDEFQNWAYGQSLAGEAVMISAKRALKALAKIDRK